MVIPYLGASSAFIFDEKNITHFKAGEVNSSANDYILIFNPTKDFYEDLVTLFPNFKSGDEKVR